MDLDLQLINLQKEMLNIKTTDGWFLIYNLSMINLLLNNLTSKQKTTTLNGVIKEKKIINMIQGHFDIILEDIIVFVDKEWKYHIFIMDELDNEDFIRLESKINKQKFLLYKIYSKNEFIYLENSGIGQKKLHEHFKFKGNTPHIINKNLVDIPKNIFLISSMTPSEQNKYIRKSSLSEYLNCFDINDSKFSLNIDGIAFKNNNISILEIKVKNLDGYDEWMNAGEYNLLRELSKIFDVKYVIQRNYDTSKNSIGIICPKFKSISETANNKDVIRIANKSTSYSGNREQKMYLLDINDEISLNNWINT